MARVTVAELAVRLDAMERRLGQREHEERVLMATVSRVETIASELGVAIAKLAAERGVALSGVASRPRLTVVSGGEGRR